MPVIICPGCGARLKVDPQPPGKFACPKCNKVMRLASSSSSEPGQSSQSSPGQSGQGHGTTESVTQSEAQPTSPYKKYPSKPIPKPKVNPPTGNSSKAVDPFQSAAMDLPPVDDGYSASSSDSQYFNNGSSAFFGGSSSVAKRTTTDFRAFGKKLAIIVGIIAVAIIASLPLTYVSNSFLRLIPILLVILALLGLVFWARIWFIVLGFAQSQSQGLMVLFVPYYWLYFLSQNKQRCIRPLMVFGASLVPGLLGIVVTTFFKPDFVGTSSRRTDLRLTSAQQAEARKILLNATTNAQPGEMLTAQFPVFMMMKPDASTLGELALLRLPGYVQGSFKIAPDQKSLTLQYRGSDRKVALHYALVLPGEAGIMLGLEPTFIDNN